MSSVTERALTFCDRYSKEHRFRPAASPIITHTLKDGSIRIHGAGPTASVTPTPIPTVKKTRGKRRPKGNKRTRSASKRK